MVIRNDKFGLAKKIADSVLTSWAKYEISASTRKKHTRILSFAFDKGGIVLFMKIKKIFIESFRGIPNTCELDFVHKNGNPCSIIIYGGNGSGKSSIIDAIEFNLQGQIDKSSALKNNSRPLAYNCSTIDSKDSITKIYFEDYTCNERSIKEVVNKFFEKHRQISSSEFTRGFGNVPFVLRRSDIIKFSNTPEYERQVLVKKFMYHLSDVKYDDSEIDSLSFQRIEKKNKRSELIHDIFTTIEINDPDEESHHKSDKNIVEFINNRVISESYKNQYIQRKKRHQTVRNFVEDPLILTDNEYSELRKKAQDFLEINYDLEKIEKDLREKKKKYSPSEISFGHLKSVYAKASEYLNKAFVEISSVDYVDKIELSIGELAISSLNINIKLNNGLVVHPNEIFSEANYDLMILLLYLSLIRVGVDCGQEKVLVLDDVLQSVDSSIRAKFVSYILRELNDWQIIITCHDRLWLNQMRFIFQRESHKYKEYNIVNWSFYGGPVIQEQNIFTIDNTLKNAISTGNYRIIASMSGLFLEMLCQKLSVSMHCSVQRTNEDKYTIGDLWPGIKKTFKKTTLRPLMDEIDNLLFVRNLLGCHYNEWAETLTDDEVLKFANSIQTLYEKVFCKTCCQWISEASGNDTACCHCQKLKY